MRTRLWVFAAVAIPALAANPEWRLTDEGSLEVNGARVSAKFYCANEASGTFGASVRIGTRTFGVSSAFAHDDALRFARKLLDAEESSVVWRDVDRSENQSVHGLLDVTVPVANFAKVWPRFSARCHDD